MRIFITALLIVLFAAHATAQRTCGAMELLQEQIKQDPTFLQRLEAQDRLTREQVGERGVTNIIYIPTVFHIVHNGDAVGSDENISDALIYAQLDQMNDDFAKLNSDFNTTPAVFQGLAANTMIQFCLAERTPDCQSTNGIHRYNGGQADWTASQVNTSLKPSTIWDRNLYMNIWTVKFAAGVTLLGYAQFPGGPANTDGVVVRYTTVGSIAEPNPLGGSYNLGRTMTHEVGHWLNLYHIWGDDTGNPDECLGTDQCADTPNQADENYGCPVFPVVSCSNGPNGDMFMNYMDYVDDDCMHMFSEDQSTRMNAVLGTGGLRSSLATSEGCNPPDISCLYCTASANQSGYEKISNIAFSDINNSSSSTIGYENLTAVTGNVNKGSSYTFTATLSNGWSADQILTWIDFNQDGDFGDSGEQVFSSSNGTGPHSTSIAIPNTATTGTTRMRVRLHDTSDGPNATPCGTSTWGQVEDYSLIIAAPLPVELTRFDAEKINSSEVMLRWETGDSEPIDGYTVEMSKTQLSGFSALAQVSKNAGRQYSHKVAGLTPDKYYFRLKMLDDNGEYHYSAVKSVLIDQNGQSISLYPNPASDQLTCQFAKPVEGNVRIEITNISGQVIYQTQTEVQDGVPFKLEVGAYPKGMYNLRVESEQSVQNALFIIK